MKALSLHQVCMYTTIKWQVIVTHILHFEAYTEVYNLHVEHTTPASLKCEQEVIPTTWWLQLNRENSVPVHPTLYRTNRPVPCPKAARVTAIAINRKKKGKKQHIIVMWPKTARSIVAQHFSTYFKLGECELYSLAVASFFIFWVL